MRIALFVVAMLALLTARPAQAQKYPPYSCDRSAPISAITSSGSTLVLAASGKQIRLCGIYIQVVQPSSSPADFSLTYGSGSACATGETQLTAVWTGVASSIQSFTDRDGGGDAALFLPAGKDLCIKLSAAPTKASVWIRYGLY